jgi:hypothetical protein
LRRPSVRIAAIHPDSHREYRLAQGLPRFNSEWIELQNVSELPVDVSGFYVINGGGYEFTISVVGRESLILRRGQSMLVFTGMPDNPRDPARCYIAEEATRVFLQRKEYIWNVEEDVAFLYYSRDDYESDPASYVDYHRFTRQGNPKEPPPTPGG